MEWNTLSKLGHGRCHPYLIENLSLRPNVQNFFSLCKNTLAQARARLQIRYKKLIRYVKIWYEISVLSIWYKTGEFRKSTILNLILRSFFMKIWMKTVINRDFSNCNCFLLTNRHNSEIIDLRRYLNFSLVSLRNARFLIRYFSILISNFQKLIWYFPIRDRTFFSILPMPALAYLPGASGMKKFFNVTKRS